MKRLDRRPTPQHDPKSTQARTRAGHILALGLRSAYLTFHRRANAVFARFKLTSDQFVLLTVLAEADGVTQGELMRRTNSDPNTISEMLGRLERRGLVGAPADTLLTGVPGFKVMQPLQNPKPNMQRASFSQFPANLSLAFLEGCGKLNEIMSSIDFFRNFLRVGDS